MPITSPRAQGDVFECLILSVLNQEYLYYTVYFDVLHFPARNFFDQQLVPATLTVVSQFANKGKE